ncbi:MAG TPA: CRISPR-associated endonuclease Cas1 [Methanocorpusculum sp.]|nr:CRISPR-associated endonuclease Cas1 [Candidatus Methanocorpusculum faecipullorum]HJK03828.1 CRISPR-associated endonuclease Cas1 [Methanocorpusculum sp.]HJK05853.1 CRISPR-associated endonuclease Cas1 [Methanocorpusculum sp.]HJK12757.1 CRISPR-associated endonuclease Cas1 [Methanocorpusculum sp.]HJK14981.1 CRISPR-associated endonuclease Cas1 [Methanocorpusculum sp.]
MSDAVPWVTVWGYGADIRATRRTLTIREGPVRRSYPLSSIRHLLIAGGHTLETAAVSHLMDNNVPVSFFDIHGEPVGTIRPSGHSAYPLRPAQKSIPVHRFAMSVIITSLKSRMGYLHELGSRRDDGLYYKGELEILTDASHELEYLITLPELSRVFLLTRTMYYEILSRVADPRLGYRRREKPPYLDPINAMLAHGYAVLYASTSVSVAGAGLDPEIGSLYGNVIPPGKNRSACVMDIMEPLMTPMVDRVVMDMAQEGVIAGRYEISSRCLLSEKLMEECNRRFAESINSDDIDRAVSEYAAAITTSTSA